MNRILSAMLLFSLQSTPPPSPVPIRLDTVLHVPEQVLGSGYSSIATIASFNHVALGIVLDSAYDTAACQISIDLKPGDITVGDLIDKFNLKFTTQKTTLDDGVIEVIPKSLPSATTHLLNLRIASFNSNAVTRSGHGNMLWMYVRNTTGPAQNSLSMGPTSTESEIVSPISTDGQTFKANLNRIVVQGEQGAWVFSVPKSKAQDSSDRQPYEIYGYRNGQPRLLEKLACSR